VHRGLSPLDEGVDGQLGDVLKREKFHEVLEITRIEGIESVNAASGTAGSTPALSCESRGAIARFSEEPRFSR
jgi:hypothetical protein